jgi:hypothetical protein
MAVNEMWKLCKTAVTTDSGERYRGLSEEFGIDFSHELFGGKPVRTG